MPEELIPCNQSQGWQNDSNPPNVLTHSHMTSACFENLLWKNSDRRAGQKCVDATSLLSWGAAFTKKTSSSLSLAGPKAATVLRRLCPQSPCNSWLQSEGGAAEWRARQALLTSQSLEKWSTHAWGKHTWLLPSNCSSSLSANSIRLILFTCRR